MTSIMTIVNKKETDNKQDNQCILKTSTVMGDYSIVFICYMCK